MGSVPSLYCRLVLANLAKRCDSMCKSYLEKAPRLSCCQCNFSKACYKRAKAIVNWNACCPLLTIIILNLGCAGVSRSEHEAEASSYHGISDSCGVCGIIVQERLRSTYR